MDIAPLFEHSWVLPHADEPLDLSALPGRGSVYAFLDRHGGLIQLISAQSLRRSVTSRLKPDPDASKKRPDLRAIAHTVVWTPSFSTFESAWIYLRLARVLIPKGYRKQLGFGPVWFARMDPLSPYPRWTAEPYAFRDGVEVGPFGTRSGCMKFIAALEDVFDLCRKYDILIQAPHGKACVYFEMGRCPAPCDGTISMDVYRATLSRSIDFARGTIEECLNIMREEMQSAAQQLQFERAGRMKAVLDDIQNDPEGVKRFQRIQRTPDQFRYLILQRGSKPSRVRPFFVDRGTLSTADEIPLRKISQAAESWWERLVQQESGQPLESVERSEILWLVSRFLAKGLKIPGLFLHDSSVESAEHLKQLITDRFSAKPKDAGTPQGVP